MPAAIEPGRPLTGAQKQARRRAGLRARGLVEVSVVIPADRREDLEAIADGMIREHEGASAMGRDPAESMEDALRLRQEGRTDA